MTGSVIDRIVQAGYPYEFVGFVFYAFFLVMTRKRDRFSQRSRALTLVAAMVLVGSVPFRYANTVVGIVAMVVVAVAAIASSWLDRPAAR